MKFRAIVMHLNDPELYPSYEDALKRIASRLNAFTVRAVLTKPSDDVDLELVLHRYLSGEIPLQPL